MQQRQRFTSEEGAGSLEFALLFGVLLTMLLMLFHFSFTFAANEAVHDAAQEALAAASESDGTPAAGQNAATLVLNGEPSVRPGWSTVVSRQAAFTTVTVTAQSFQILPGLPTSVSSTVEGPTERFIRQADR